MIRHSPIFSVLLALCPCFATGLTAQSSLSGGAAAADAGAATLLGVPAVTQPARTVVPEAVAEPLESARKFDASSVFGLSGALRAAVLLPSEPVADSLMAAVGAGPSDAHWVPVLGTVRQGLPGEPVSRAGIIAPDGAGVWQLETGSEASAGEDDSLAFITTVPFAEKRQGYLNGYHIGVYPAEGSRRNDGYAPPEGFIEVTVENQDLPVSEHFLLRDFLTKDQFDVWPKYLALNLRLIDKLELVLQELNRMGVRALDLHIMSGFRTPQYNGPGGDGRAALSRHMYGDAADVWVDGDHDGYIDDLNGDGRHDIADAEVLLRAVERVEQRYPELTGGAGLYDANGYHGPFVHVDVRGNRARW